MGFVKGNLETKYPTPDLRLKLLTVLYTDGKDEKLNVYDFCLWENMCPACMAISN